MRLGDAWPGSWLELVFEERAAWDQWCEGVAAWAALL